MQTLPQFIQQWNGKYIKVLPATVSGQQSPQCFDVAAGWTDNLGIPHYPNNPSPFPVQFAYEIFANFSTWQAQYFDRIANGLFNEPQAGDLVIYKPGFNNGAGDVVIATGKNQILTFECFGQNYPLGSVCRIRLGNYGYLQSSGIYGWLHPKTVVTPLPLTDSQKIQAHKDIVNTNISDSDYRNKSRSILGV